MEHKVARFYQIPFDGLGFGAIAKCNCTVQFTQVLYNFILLFLPFYLYFFYFFSFFILNGLDLKLLFATLNLNHPYQLHQVQYLRYCT